MRAAKVGSSQQSGRGVASARPAVANDVAALATKQGAQVDARSHGSKRRSSLRRARACVHALWRARAARTCSRLPSSLSVPGERPCGPGVGVPSSVVISCPGENISETTEDGPAVPGLHGGGRAARRDATSERPRPERRVRRRDDGAGVTAAAHWVRARVGLSRLGAFWALGRFGCDATRAAGWGLRLGSGGHRAGAPLRGVRAPAVRLVRCD